jgi:hypothetical protein
MIYKIMTVLFFLQLGVTFMCWNGWKMNISRFFHLHESNMTAEDRAALKELKRDLYTYVTVFLAFVGIILFVGYYEGKADADRWWTTNYPNSAQWAYDTGKWLYDHCRQWLPVNLKTPQNPATQANDLPNGWPVGLGFGKSPLIAKFAVPGRNYMLYTTKIPEQCCPFCGKSITTVKGEGLPIEGDVTVCYECLEISVFDDQLKMRKPTADEEKEFIAMIARIPSAVACNFAIRSSISAKTAS